MINWLGNYNYDYVLASIPIQLILLILYCLRRNLPVGYDCQPGNDGFRRGSM